VALREQTLVAQGEQRLAELALGVPVTQAMLGMQAAQATPAAVAADIVAAAQGGRGRLDVGGIPKEALAGPPLFACVAYTSSHFLVTRRELSCYHLAHLCILFFKT
jgi:hypothetical protein